MERQVEHLKIALSPEENDLNIEIKRSDVDSNSKVNEGRIKTREEEGEEKKINDVKSETEEDYFISKHKIKSENNNKGERISKKFKNKVNELEQYIEKSKNKEIEIVKIDHSKSRSKSKDYSNDKEKDHSPISQKFKKTKMKAAFGKLLNEKKTLILSDLFIVSL